MIKYEFTLKKAKSWTLIVLFLMILFLEPSKCNSLAESEGLFIYRFVVNNEGFTIVDIIYTNNESEGSSWVFVPKFTLWESQIVKGELIKYELSDTEDLTGNVFYFYDVMVFSYESDSIGFQMNLNFNLSTAAMIIEPNGIFYSPQIGFEEGSNIEIEIIFTDEVEIEEAYAFGTLNSYKPVYSNSTRTFFNNIPTTENLIRLEISFGTKNKIPEILKLERGVFSFETVHRYADYAHGILDLYSQTYDDLVKLFNVTLEKTDIRFFLPDFDYLLLIGGYVPFTSNEMGSIHVNIVFTRYVEGYIEVIALHELIHHFLWKVGISPEKLLWFHEGMAQYVSLEIANMIGYEGSELMMEDLQQEVKHLFQTTADFGFLQYWSPSSEPSDIGTYYVAGYYVVRSLAQDRGGLEFYARFFELIRDEEIKSNMELGYYLSLSVDESIVYYLNQWGFDIPDLYTYSPFLIMVKQAIDEVSSFSQPFKYISDMLYQQALSNARMETKSEMLIHLFLAYIVAKLASWLTTVMVASIFYLTIIFILKKKDVF